MKESIFDRIKASQSLFLSSYIETLIPGGAWHGDRYVAAGLEGGKGESFSFSLSKGIGTDYATEDKGSDIIDIAAKIWRLKKMAAAKKIASEWGLELTERKSFAKKTKTEEKKYIPVHPIPDGEDLTISNWWIEKHGDVQDRWCYHNAKGEPIGWVVRFQSASAKAIPFQWCGNDGWRSVGFAEPRPIYDLH